MKRSNVIFFSLISVLFIAPFILMGIFYFIPGKGDLTGFGNKYEVIKIENPDLKAENVKLQFEDTDYPNITFGGKQLLDNKSYAYYQNGNKKIMPAYKTDGKTLIVSKPKKEKQFDNITLHINTKNIKQVILNNSEIWCADKNDQEEEFMYVPGLTNKINSFVDNYVALHNEINSAKE